MFLSVTNKLPTLASVAEPILLTKIDMLYINNPQLIYLNLPPPERHFKMKRLSLWKQVTKALNT